MKGRKNKQASWGSRDFWKNSKITANYLSLNKLLLFATVDCLVAKNAANVACPLKGSRGPHTRWWEHRSRGGWWRWLQSLCEPIIWVGRRWKRSWSSLRWELRKRPVQWLWLLHVKWITSGTTSAIWRRSSLVAFARLQKSMKKMWDLLLPKKRP